MPNRPWRWITGTVARGHRVASGMAEDSPYEDSSVKLQTPFFKARGVEIACFFPGTVNVHIAPLTPKSITYDVTLDQVNWHHSIEPEDFSFLALQLKYRGTVYPAMLYYPHLDTKPAQFTPPDVLEALAPKIEGLAYGDEIELAYPDGSIVMKPLANS